MKKWVPVGKFEQHTGICPTYVALQVLDEAKDYLRAPIPDSYADKLAQRAEAVFLKNSFWRRKYQGRQGREYLLMSLRHWLAAELAKNDPRLFRELPEEFKIGRPLPFRKQPRARKRPSPRVRYFRHGWELLMP